MKRTLRIVAVVLAVMALMAWIGLGANRGWTRTSTAVKTLDPVTGIEGIEYQRRFVPGLDFLGSTLLAAGLLAGASLLFNKQQNKQNQT